MLIVLLASVLALGYPNSPHFGATQTDGHAANVEWLGEVPPDELYSTRMLDIAGGKGIIVTEHTILSSEDGGHNWKVRAKLGIDEEPSEIDGAWLDSASLLYVVSGGALFMSPNLGSSWKQMNTERRDANYLMIAGDRDHGLIVLVGGRSISIPHKQWLTLPKYAVDNSTASPDRMVIPAISISNDQGRTWRSVELPKAIGHLDGVRMTGDYGVAWGPYAVYASTDAGVSWKIMRMDVPHQEEEAYPVSAAIAGKEIRVSLKNGRILGGQIDGHVLSPLAQLSESVGALSFVDSCVGYGIAAEEAPTTEGGDVLMRTEDGGAKWVPVLHSKRIVTLSVSESDLYGAIVDHLFRIHASGGITAHYCER